MAINCKFLHHTCLFGAPLPLNVGVIGSPAPWPKEETPSRARWICPDGDLSNGPVVGRRGS